MDQRYHDFDGVIQIPDLIPAPRGIATRTDTLRPHRRVRFRSVAIGLAIACAVASCDRGSSEDEVDIARGAALYEANCISCHGGATGGEISDIPPRHNAEGHTWHHADCDLVEIVRDGIPRRTGYPEMPAFGDRLTDDEIRSILVHIKSW